MEAAELDLFRRTLERVVGSSSGPALDTALEGVGWNEALEADPVAAIPLLFELQGAANATSSALMRVIAGGPAVLPPLGSTGPPGAVEGKLVHVVGLVPGEVAGPVLVATSGGETRAVVVPLEALTTRQVQGMDPHLGLVEVYGDAELAAPAPFDWTEAKRRGQLALGHEILGASRRMLDLAREHALERVQFGRPIATFQAVRHRLADTLIAIEAANAALESAWEDAHPTNAEMAKALAGRAGRVAARHCQQVLAGLGFTTEHALHRYVRRVLVLDELLGPARVLTRRLGERVIVERRLPVPQPL